MRGPEQGKNQRDSLAGNEMEWGTLSPGQKQWRKVGKDLRNNKKIVGGRTERRMGQIQERDSGDVIFRI